MDTSRILDHLLDQTGIGYFIQDATGHVVYCNESMAYLWGLESAEAVIDKKVWAFVAESSERALVSLLATPRRGTSGVEIEWNGRHGTTWSSLIFPSYMSRETMDGGGLAAIVVDVSAHRPSWNQLIDTVGRLSKVDAALLDTGAPNGMSAEVLAQLSGREREVAELLYAGETTPSIVERLEITENTVRNHIKSIYKKLEVRTRGQLFATLRGASPAGQ